MPVAGEKPVKAFGLSDSRLRPPLRQINRAARSDLRPDKPQRSAT
jgi:hypothetical protein